MNAIRVRRTNRCRNPAKGILNSHLCINFVVSKRVHLIQRIDCCNNSAIRIVTRGGAMPKCVLNRRLPTNIVIAETGDIAP